MGIIDILPPQLLRLFRPKPTTHEAQPRFRLDGQTVGTQPAAPVKIPPKPQAPPPGPAVAYPWQVGVAPAVGATAASDWTRMSDAYQARANAQMAARITEGWPEASKRIQERTQKFATDETVRWVAAQIAASMGEWQSELAVAAPAWLTTETTMVTDLRGKRNGTKESRKTD